jgi:hypothetical protein
MNNIQEMDWAEECWHGHTGMDSSCEYCKVDTSVEQTPHDTTKEGRSVEERP